MSYKIPTWYLQQIYEWVPSIDPQSINVVVSGTDNCTAGLVNIISYDLMVKKKEVLGDKGHRVVIIVSTFCDHHLIIYH